MAVNSFFVLSEYSLISVRQSRIQELVDDGNVRARIVHQLQKDLERTLNSLQLGVTVTTLALGWLSEETVRPITEVVLEVFHLHANGVAAGVLFGLCCGLVIYVQVILGEQVPKLVSINMSEAVALRLSRAITVYCVTVRPIVWLFGKTISGVLSMLPVDQRDPDQGTVVTPDELEIILHQSELAGELTERQADMLEGVLDLHDDYFVGKAMTPLDKIDAVQESITLHDLVLAFARTKRSKLVVYRRSLQNVVGVIHSKDLFDMLVNLLAPVNVAHKVGFSMRRWMRPIYMVKHCTRAGDVVDEMRRRHTQIAIVVDDNGKNVGLVTMEDLLEKIVGDISDHHEKPKSPPEQPPPGKPAA